MTRKTEEERLSELDQKIEQMKARKAKLEAQLKQKERKERTRRLIEVGAIFEKYFEVSSVEEAKKIAEVFNQPVKTYLKSGINPLMASSGGHPPTME